MQIRDATLDDAPAATLVLRRSITDLCIQDHANNEAILGPWLRNKTPQSVAAWVSQPGSSLLVAVKGDAILAVGSVTDGGEITLNYVSPDARFAGVSRALLAALEARAAERGCVRCILTSTVTAHRFYLARGYTDWTPSGIAPPRGHPMVKNLERQEPPHQEHQEPRQVTPSCRAAIGTPAQGG